MQLERVGLAKQTSYTIGDSVYYSLRKNIINLNMKPGEVLNLREISEYLNVSRSPVRDAVIKLGKEGLVDIVPQKGTSVSKIDLECVAEERFLRESLEEKAVQIFMHTYKENDIYRLKENIMHQKRSLAEKDYTTLLDYDDEFHSVFFESTHKTRCWEIIQSMSGHYRRMRLLSSWETEIVENVVTQHIELMNNIEAGNTEIVMEITKKHLSKIRKEEKQLLEKYKEYFSERQKESFF